MKKLMVLLCAGLLLAGCGGKEESKPEENRETKVCTLEASGINMEINASAVDDIIDKIEVAITMPLDGVDEDTITDEMKTQMEEAALAQYGVEKGEGVEVSTDFSDGKLTVKVGMDIANASDKTKEALGLDKAGDQKLSEFVAEAEKNGATCK